MPSRAQESGTARGPAPGPAPTGSEVSAAGSDPPAPGPTPSSRQSAQLGHCGMSTVRGPASGSRSDRFGGLRQWAPPPGAGSCPEPCWHVDVHRVLRLDAAPIAQHASDRCVRRRCGQEEPPVLSSSLRRSRRLFTHRKALSSGSPSTTTSRHGAPGLQCGATTGTARGAHRAASGAWPDQGEGASPSGGHGAASAQGVGASPLALEI